MHLKQRLLTYTDSSLGRSRKLRREMTQYERRLWAYLRNSKLGVKFRRQAPIGMYIVDFLAVRAMLVVELDGIQHLTKEGKCHDKVRDRFLIEQGLAVLRFNNQDIVKSIRAVVDQIRENVNCRLK